MTTAPSDTLQLTAIDAMGSLLSAVSGQGTREDFRYSPYGSSANRSSATSLVGFNGERMDPISGTYHLGNGYRAYNPVLMRFNCPDSLSPFGAGGINPYVYCVGDPINRFDPSGHLSWQAWVGIGMGIFGILVTVVTGGIAIAAVGGVAAALSSASTTSLVVGGLGLAADVTGIASGALEESNPEASAILGWVSLGTGLGSLGVLGGSAALRRLTKIRGGYHELPYRVIYEERQLDNMGGFIKDLSGFTDNYHGKGKPAILTHGSKNGKLLYAEGTQIVDTTGKVTRDFDLADLVSPEKFVDLLKGRQGINLKIGGNTGSDPLYLIACYAARGGKNSAAQHMADYTGRTVYAYSKNSVRSTDIKALELGHTSFLGRVDYQVSTSNKIFERIRVGMYNIRKNIGRPSGTRRQWDKLPKIIFRPGQAPIYPY